MAIDFKAINQQRKQAEEILLLIDKPEEFQKAVRSTGVTGMVLRFVVKELLRKKVVESTSGEKVYMLYQAYTADDYAVFLDYIDKIRKGDLEKLCMALRACRDKDNQ